MKSSKRFVRAFFVSAIVGLIVLPVALIAAEQEPIAKSVFAIKYADDSHPMPMYAAFWMGPRFFPNEPDPRPSMYYYLIKTEKENILVDVGAGPEMAAQKKLSNYFPPEVMLNKFGLKTSDIQTIIITHGHWDHIDALDQYKNAKIYIQRSCYRFMVEEGPELAFFRKTGYPNKKHSFAMLTAMWDNQIRLIDGDAELFPGIKVIKVDGHHPGQQIVVVETKDKPIVLASDAVYYYSNLEKDHPIGMYTGSLRDVIKGLETIRQLNGVVVPGHEPKVMERFKSIDKEVVQIFP